MNEKKRVLFLITKATWGGAQRYVYDLATHLSKDTFEPIVAYGESGRLQKMLVAAEIGTRHIPTLGRDIAFVSDITSFFQIFVCMWRVRPDVVHLNSSKAAALGALAARILFVPKIIFTAHGWPFKENRSALARRSIYFISWFTAFLSHSVIVVSKEDETLGKKMFGSGKKVHYIPLGIDPPEFLSREEASTSLSISTTVPRIVTIAELTSNKGLRFGIEALSLLTAQGIDAHYTIIGNGEQRMELEDAAMEFGVEDRVNFVGFISEASKYLRAFDVFLLPSIKEGMPYVLLEAASAGLRIVTTTAVSAEVAVGYADIIRVIPKNPEAIADAISKMLHEPHSSEKSPPAEVSNFLLSEMLVKTTALYLPALPAHAGQAD